MCYNADRSARAANSLLLIKHPGEVALIPPHPDWNGITLGNLKNISGPAVARLASDQGLTPSEGLPDSEPVRVDNLNIVLRHLGVSCARLHPRASKPGPTDGESGFRSGIRPFPRGTAPSSRGRHNLDPPSRGSPIPISCVPHPLRVLEHCPVATLPRLHITQLFSRAIHVVSGRFV